MQKLRIPSKEECYALLKHYKTPKHVIRHCEMVAKVSAFLAVEMQKAGIKANRSFVEAAGLLHDLFKIVDFFSLDECYFDKEDIKEDNFSYWQSLRRQYKGWRHEDLAYEVLKKDYPEIALSIKRHRYSAIADMEKENWRIEDKILTYADKRVMHSSVVSLAQRFEDGHKRYKGKHDPETAKRCDRLFFMLEKELFRNLAVKPEEIGNFVCMDE